MRTVRLLLLALVAACSSSSSSEPELTCLAPEGPGWCFCVEGERPGEPAVVDECSIGSVEDFGTRGLCCQGSEVPCECSAVGCYQNGPGYCGCGMTQVFGDDDAVEVALCTATEPDHHCCLDSVLVGSCSCGFLECSSGQTEATSCSVADIADCGPGETAVTSCL